MPGEAAADEDPLVTALRTALLRSRELYRLAEGRLLRIPTRSIAHDHIAVEDVTYAGLPVLLRVPRISQWSFEAETQHAYETFAFARAQHSGVTPRLLGTLPPDPALLLGALVVERIYGTKPHLPRDLASLAQCLARLHRDPPPPAQRPPLLVHDNAAVETFKIVTEQAGFIDAAHLPRAAAEAIRHEIAKARLLVVRASAWPTIITLTGTDTHPGNFLVSPERAVFVDLEKALYGNPAVDLAHATLYTSTMWDPDCAVVLAQADVARFHAAYFAAASAARAAILKPWIAPLRRLVWLRTMTWCVRWRVVSRSDNGWSKARLAPSHAAYIERTIDDYLDPARIASVSAALAEEPF